MKKLLFTLFLSVTSALHATYTYNLANCSQDAFEDCYYRGMVNGVFVKYPEDGDVIVLPAGTATWGADSRANNGKIYISDQVIDGRPPFTSQITIRGQGDSTVITLDDTGAVYAQGVINLLGSRGTVWSYMKIKGAGDRPVTCFIIGGSGVRIHHVTYEGQPDSVPNNGQAGDGYFIFQQGWRFGTLIDHCTISAAIGSQEWIFTRGPTDAWQSASVVGTSQQDLFVEDCVFNNTGYSDANANASQVFRFNTINGSIKFDAHGMASNSPARSFRSVEYYGNTWTNAAMAFNAAMEIRGGTAMVFNNSSVSGNLYLTDYTATANWPNSATMGYWNGNILATPSGSVTNINTPLPHGYSNGMSVWHAAFGGGGIQVPSGYYTITVVDATNYTIPITSTGGETLQFISLLKTPYNWPLFDQVGNGRDGFAREPAYLWGNTQGGGAWQRGLMGIPQAGIDTYRVQIANPLASYTERDIIAPNRDFFASAGFDLSTGVSVGTRAAMDAYTPSVAGYGWWVTDEGSWNQKVPAGTSGRLYKWTGSAWSLYYTPYTYPHPLQTATECSQPEPSTPSGTYEYAQSITFGVSPSDAIIRYTTDGSVPSHTVGTIYTGTPVSITTTTNLKAIAYKTGLGDSPVLDAVYTITGQVFQPTSSKPSGSYHGTQTVVLACQTTGATIHYTIDGSTPTGSSPTYSTALSVESTTTIKAIGIKSGLTDSTILTRDITILNEIGNWDVVTTSQQPIYNTDRTGYAYFTATVTGNLTQISVYGDNTSATQDIEFGLYYDPSGNNAGGLDKVAGTPAQFTNVGTWTGTWKDFAVNFPVVQGNKYWIWMQVSENSSLGITATYAGGNNDRWNNGGTYGSPWPDTWGATTNRDGWRYNIKGTLVETGGSTPTAATPTGNIAGGFFYAATSLTLSTTTSGASIYFTLDGTYPTTSSTLYTTPIALNLGPVGVTPIRVRAIAVKSGMNNSAAYDDTFQMVVPGNTVTIGTLTVNQLVLP